jgi:hypothetical protein
VVRGCKAIDAFTLLIQSRLNESITDAFQVEFEMLCVCVIAQT